jgi:hypothetical protein
LFDLLIGSSLVEGIWEEEKEEASHRALHYYMDKRSAREYHLSDG